MFDAGEKDCEMPVNPVDVSDVQAEEVPEYQRYEYGGVPVVGADIVRVVDWPLSMTGLVAEGAAEAMSAGLTVTGAEATLDVVAGVEAWSVAVTS